MKIAMIDNYDSFTYNLVHYFRECDGVELETLRNDKIDPAHLKHFDKIVISPGPGVPSESGNILDIIRYWSGVKPLFGICLGLQAIYESFGGKLLNLSRVFHGVSSEVKIIAEDPILKDLSNPFKAGRYHSWVCDPAHLPSDIIITAWDTDNEIMACRHKEHPTFGVQFHPESILTPDGKRMIRNFVNI